MASRSSVPNSSPIPLAFGAAVGGFVYGVLGGFTEGLNWSVAVHLGFMCLVSGATAGIIGYYVFKAIPSRKLVPMMVKIGIIGSIFMTLRFFLINGYVPEFDLAGNLLVTAIGGALGGAFGGFTMWLFKSK